MWEEEEYLLEWGIGIGFGVINWSTRIIEEISLIGYLSFVFKVLIL